MINNARFGYFFKKPCWVRVNSWSGSGTKSEVLFFSSMSGSTCLRSGSWGSFLFIRAAKFLGTSIGNWLFFGSKYFIFFGSRSRNSNSSEALRIASPSAIFQGGALETAASLCWVYCTIFDSLVSVAIIHCQHLSARKILAVLPYFEN